LKKAEPILIVSTGSSGVFATATLARRLERAEAGLIEDGARAAAQRLGGARVLIVPLAGGVAVFTEPGSPFNKVAGLGFEGVPDGRLFDRIEREFGARGAPVQIELSSLGDPEIARAATRRGYELVGFENVLGLRLAPDVGAAPAAGESITVAPAAAGDNRAWLDTVATGFLHPDAIDGPPSHESFDRETLERVYIDITAAAGFERYLAWRAGEIAGGASLRMSDGVAQLCGAATLPAHRRRGVQSALLRHRLALAAARGCDIAVVTTQPGSKSQENVQRFGFSLLYVRAILVKPPQWPAS
jgi:ribosomal protein S18 acetylase RimI-like enzyme